MKAIFGRAVTFAALTLAAIFGAAMPAQAEELVVYTALEDDEIAVYRKDFEQKHPEITLKIVRDSTGIITSKLLAEAANPQADVIWGTAATSLLLCEQKGMLEGYAPKNVEKVRAGFKDTMHATPNWVGIKAWMTGFANNTVEMKKLNLAYPMSYADLIKPEFKGKLVMPNPASSGTGFLTISAILQLMGEEKGWEYLDKLHANIAIYTHSGSKPARMAGKGEYPVGISFAYRALKQAAAGEPVVLTMPAEGSGWDVEANALVKKPQIKASAKVFLDWALSDDAMLLYSQFYPITAYQVEGQKIPEGFPTDPEKQLIKNDFMWAAQNRERIQREWSNRYDSKSEPK